MLEAADTLGARIRRRREEMGMSREKLADKAGVSAQTILRLEQESDGTTLGAVRRIMAALNLVVAVWPVTSERAVPLYGWHTDQPEVLETMNEAAAAAAAVLNQLFPADAGEGKRVGPAFEARLVDHFTAMLSGRGGARNSERLPLPTLVYSYGSLGMPFSLPREAEGYLVRVDSLDLYLDPAEDYATIKKAFIPLAALQECYRSWDSAALAARNAVVAGHFPLGPLTIVPGGRLASGELTALSHQPNGLVSSSRLLPNVA